MNALITLKSLPKTTKEIIELSEDRQDETDYYVFNLKMDFPNYHLSLGKDFRINKEIYEKSEMIKSVFLPEHKKAFFVKNFIGGSLLKNVSNKKIDFEFTFGAESESVIETFVLFDVEKRIELLNIEKKRREEYALQKKLVEIEQNENVILRRVIGACMVDYTDVNNNRKFVLLKKHDDEKYPFNFYTERVKDVKDSDKDTIYFMANSDLERFLPDTDFERRVLSGEEIDIEKLQDELANGSGLDSSEEFDSVESTNLNIGEIKTLADAIANPNLEVATKNLEEEIDNEKKK